LKYVATFATSPVDPERVGARGAWLAQMARLGLPIPPGFTIDSVACRRFLETGDLPDSMWAELGDAVKQLARGPAHDRPLVLAVRASPPVPMPGLMDTVLNLGVTEETMTTMAEWASDRFAAEIRTRFLYDFATTVRRVPIHRLDAVAVDARGAADLSSASADELRRVADAYHDLILEETQRPVPATLAGQLREAIEAVFASWDRAPARRFQRTHDISHDLGSAALVHWMAFGTRPGNAGTGVAFSRHPVTGAPAPGGIYEPGAARPATQLRYPGLEPLAATSPAAHRRLLDALELLERERRAVVRVDFACEGDDLFLLEARPATQAPAGAVRSVVDMVDEGRLTEAEAVLQIDPESLDGMLHPHLAPYHTPPPIAVGAAASPGAASGPAVFNVEDAVAADDAGTKAILLVRDAGPDDVAGVTAAAGVLTSHGGRTSHGAVVARGIGIPMVTGAGGIVIDEDAETLRIGDRIVIAGEVLTIDGSTGSVYLDALAIDRPVTSSELGRLLGWADGFRRMEVWANADTPQAARAAREAGAGGIGLARTEYMFSGERLAVVRRILLSEDDRERAAALESLEALQVGDFERLLEAMDGMRVVVRLLDPPLHEFLPSRLEVDHEIQAAREAGTPTADLERLGAAIDRFQESNPMLGLRGVRLAVVMPEIYRVQVLAALEAVRRRLDAGGDPRLDLVIPLVGTPAELHLIRDMIEEEVHYAGRQLEVGIGTMIEVPRAALVAADLALASDFFSFGTNDLTQTTLGISRDDAEEAFLRTYLERGVMRRNPFRTLDATGVGRLIRVAIEEGRAVNPGLEIGVCGEHGGDPISIGFFHRVGVDYVSCSPPRLPIARLAAAQAALADR
jgi:pyruvate,orthophosphate dikinase